MAYRSTPCPSGPNHLSPAENFLGCKLRTVLDLMNPCPEDHVGPRDVKMETLCGRRHGARCRRFEVDDAVYVKDNRGQKSTWTPGFVVRRTGNATYTVCCEDLLWNRHVNQPRPRRSASTVNQLVDVFDLYSSSYSCDLLACAVVWFF
ncbi:hypothetical protein Y032_0577g225 [Ancylostoma ceylanicum]|uniref:Uncharacterized protein n=1 Tax=Ancylostoma ceylanicum TaxID=53326 RepID=A0A016WNG6_9BILA|nr:hypothetical protein Y032_0577g225 [Ancylostoma ceylanicum]